MNSILVRYVKIVMLGIAGLLAPAWAFADSACVTNGVELQSAMLQWLLMDSGTMTIKLVKGTYTLAPSNEFYAVREVNLNLLGGYRPGTNCTERDVDPTNTALYGANSSDVTFWIYTFSDVTIEGLTFKNLRNGFLLRHEFDVNATGHTFSVRYNIFRDFQVVARAVNSNIDGGVVIDGGFYLDYTGAFVSFKNNLVFNIQMGDSEPAVSLTSGHDGVLSVAYNTIGFNNTPSMIGSVAPLEPPELVNNILWNGAATALKFGLDLIGPDARYNVLGPVVGFLSNDVANIYGDPMWGANYHLAPGSPAINSGGGAELVSGGFPSHDLDGNPRIVGSAIDRGAYESPYDNAVDFTVTSTLDAAHATNGNVNCNAGSSTCTLREAIVRANASAGSSKIKFALACPTIVTLSSPLPDITGATTIDGYTNPGASPNTSATSFNATLCMFLNGNGSVSHALHTAGSGKLVLNGLGFAGFSIAAVQLDQGIGHVIGGSQFGAIAFTSGNEIGVKVSGSAMAFVGGNDSDAARNLISGSVYAGVYLDSSAGGTVVANNFIGLQADGTTTLPNENGVVVVDSPGNSVAYNVIAASAANGVWLYGADTKNTIVNYNIIGYAADGQTQRPTNGIGILVDGGASGNIIGAAANSTSGGNAVLSSGGAAIAVTNTGAIGNRILGNAPVKGATDKPAIDLGQSGATANDNGDTDVGANNLQNFPVIKNLFRTATAEWVEWTLDSTPGDAFRLDFYRDLCCAQGPGVPPRGNVGVYLLRAGSGVTDMNGHAHGWLRLSKFSTLLTWTVAATATSTSGDTSELGPYTAESTDMLFRDDFEVH
ncbi:MAG TPA: choice-of-anchor Q domain-containing protein [Vicinamibacterales bacterium]|nr:choice-of-anchor Q domain-containing protein [Vicinamibacterales bacterium]